MGHESLPPGQQLVASGKWPTIGEREPRTDDAPWSVTVGGAVTRPRTWTLDDLRRLPQVEENVDIHCVTRWSKLGVRFGGVLLRSLVEDSLAEPAACFVSFVARSQRGHSTSLLLADALQLDTLVALSADGDPLSTARGGPVRVVVPGRYFYKSLKWLEKIELLAQDRLGYWEHTAGYHNTADPWLQQRYMAGQITRCEADRILAARDISGLDLRSLAAGGRDLRGLKAERALLRDADFRGCSLQDASFVGANLSNAHLEGADLRRSNFRGADLEGADFSGADLRGACLLGASLCGTTFFDPGTIDPWRGAAVLDSSTQLDATALESLAPEQEVYLRACMTRP